MAKIIDLGIDDTNNLVFAWYNDGNVTAGSSKDLSSRRDPKPYALPDGMQPKNVVGMAIDGTNNFVFAWYDDGTVSAGTSTDLGSRRKRTGYTLAQGKKPSDVIGMGIDGGNNLVLAWYDDNQVSGGSTTDLDKRRDLRPYTLAQNKTPANVVGFAVDGIVFDFKKIADLVSDVVDTDVSGIIESVLGLGDLVRNLSFAWYDDGTVSAGKTTKLDLHRSAYKYVE